VSTHTEASQKLRLRKTHAFALTSDGFASGMTYKAVFIYGVCKKQQRVSKTV